MPNEHCLIVHAAGRQLDLQINWWTDRAEVGTRFCFEDVGAKEAFALACDNFGIRCRDG